MIIRMRTTLIVDDALLRKAKEHAARRGVSLSELVTQALRDLLAERSRPRRRFMMPTFKGGQRTRHEPRDMAAELERDDLVSVGR